MTVTIIRKTGWIGLLGSIAIRVDGEKIGKVNDRQTIQLEIPRDEVLLHVTQQGSRSNKLQVKKGDRVMIKIRKSVKLLYLLMCFTPFLTSLFLPGYENQLLIGLIVIIGLAANLFIFDFFQITKIP